MAQTTSQQSPPAATDAAALDGLTAAIEKLLPGLEEFLVADGPDLAVRDRSTWIATLDRDLPADGAETSLVPSTARIEGKLAIRPCIVNPATTLAEVDALADRVVEIGDRVLSSR